MESQRRRAGTDLRPLKHLTILVDQSFGRIHRGVALTMASVIVESYFLRF
jgi:hypothetical protein